MVIVLNSHRLPDSSGTVPVTVAGAVLPMELWLYMSSPGRLVLKVDFDFAARSVAVQVSSTTISPAGDPVSRSTRGIVATTCAVARFPRASNTVGGASPNTPLTSPVQPSRITRTYKTLVASAATRVDVDVQLSSTDVDPSRTTPRNLSLYTSVAAPAVAGAS